MIAIKTLIVIQSGVLYLAEANPKSRPYVAYRGDPFDQEIVSRKILEGGIEKRGGSGQ